MRKPHPYNTHITHVDHCVLNIKTLDCKTNMPLTQEMLSNYTLMLQQQFQLDPIKHALWLTSQAITQCS